MAIMFLYGDAEWTKIAIAVIPRIQRQDRKVLAEECSPAMKCFDEKSLY